MTTADLNDLIASQAPFRALYEAGYFTRVAASENDPRLSAFRSELYAEEFDAEYDAEAQAADAYLKDGR